MVLGGSHPRPPPTTAPRSTSHGQPPTPPRTGAQKVEGSPAAPPIASPAAALPQPLWADMFTFGVARISATGRQFFPHAWKAGSLCCSPMVDMIWKRSGTGYPFSDMRLHESRHKQTVRLITFQSLHAFRWRKRLLMLLSHLVLSCHVQNSTFAAVSFVLLLIGGLSRIFHDVSEVPVGRRDRFEASRLRRNAWILDRCVRQLGLQNDPPWGRDHPARRARPTGTILLGLETCRSGQSCK